MSYNFVDGFSHYNTLADLQTKWTSSSSQASSNATIGSGFTFETGANRRNSFGQSLGIASGSALMFDERTLNVQAGQFMFGAMRDTAATRTLVSGYKTGTGQAFRLTWKSDGTFELFNQADVSQGVSSAVANDVNTWHFINFFAPIDNPATVLLYVDGTLVKTWTGVDTMAAGTGTFFKEYWFGGVNGAAGTGTTFYISDVVLSQGTRTSSPALTTETLVVETLYPNGTGDLSDLVNSGGSSVNNYSYVDEHPPDNADYVEGGAENIDLYTFPPSHTTGGFYTIQLSATVRSKAGDAGSFQEGVDAMFKWSGGSETFYNSYSSNSLLTGSFELRAAVPGAIALGSIAIDGTTQWGLRTNHNGSTTHKAQASAVALEIVVPGLVTTKGWTVGWIRIG